MFGLNKNKPAEKAEINEMSDLETEILRSYTRNPEVWTYLNPGEEADSYRIRHIPSGAGFTVRAKPTGAVPETSLVVEGVPRYVGYRIILRGRCILERKAEITSGEIRFSDAFAKAMHTLFSERFNRKADAEAAEKKPQADKHLREAFGLVPRTGGAS